MKREIKFRARIIEDGKPKMFYQEDQYLISFLRRVTNHLYFEKDFQPEQVTDMAGGIHEGRLKPYELENCLDRYTGLKDKHGKEIYEGDILDMTGRLDDYQIYGEIVWDNTESCWGYIKSDENECGNLMDLDIKQYEIIGNVYENKNLLT